MLMRLFDKVSVCLLSGLIFLGCIYGAVGIRAIREDDLSPEYLGIGLIVWCGAYYLLTLPYRANRNRCKSLSKKFATAYKKALATEPTRFADLPVMPVCTPYDSDCETTVMATAISASNVEAFLDAFVAEFYETTGGDVALMQGNGHTIATGKARSVLAVKAVKRRGELAVVALTVKPVGRVANVSIRWSCWPASIWPGQGAGLWRVLYQEILGDSWRETIRIRYFKPRVWNLSDLCENHMCSWVPGFGAETKAEAQDLALMANAVLLQMTAINSGRF